MTLRTRLSLLVALLLSTMAIVMGGAAVELSHRTAVRAADDALLAVATRATAARDDGLSTALYAASVQQRPVAVALLDGSSATWLVGDEDNTLPTTLTGAPGDASVETVVLDRAYRMLQARLADGESVLLATDITALLADRSSNLRSVLLLALLLAAIGAATARVLVRRDLRRIHDLATAADRIAQGALDTPLPTAVGPAEVDLLASSLDRMLTALRSSFDALQASHAQLRTFLGDVSHELRTPLTVVRGYVELLESGDQLSPEMRERAVQRSLSEMDRMQSLIADLLLLAEFAEERAPVREPVDLRDLVRDGVLDLMSLQPARPVDVDLPSDPLVVAGDTRALASLCSNLLGNIRRHTPATAPVRVSLEPLPDSALLIIEDGGPGLTSEQYAAAEHAFERFSRLRSETTGGSGLGLRIVATVVRMHGGSLQLLPSGLGGLRVECRLPAADARLHSLP